MTLSAPEPISVRSDGTYRCWRCDAVLATSEAPDVVLPPSEVVMIINGYSYAGVTAIGGSHPDDYWNTHPFPLGGVQPFPKMDHAIPVFRPKSEAVKDYRRDCERAERGDVRARERLQTGQSTKNVAMYAIVAPPAVTRRVKPVGNVGRIWLERRQSALVVCLGCGSRNGLGIY